MFKKLRIMAERRMRARDEETGETATTQQRKRQTEQEQKIAAGVG